MYFPESGFASVVANGESELEIGMIGREGMTGVSVIMGDDTRAPHQTYMQVAGQGQRLSAEHLREAIGASGSLLKVLLLYAHSFMTQSTETALANGRHKIEERLSRWLLMAGDRVGDEIPLTHEFLGVMLGVARPGVTLVLQELERRGWVSHRRGVVTILDRGGLIKNSNGAYVQAYNAQAVVDDAHQIITAADVTTNASDAGSYPPMMEQCAANTGVHRKQAPVERERSRRRSGASKA